MMKKLASFVLLASFGAVMVGCSASADIDPNHSGSGSSEKQTTTVQHPDGSVDQTVKTQNNP